MKPLAILCQIKGKKFSVKIKCKYGRAWKKYRNKEGLKTQEDYSLQKSRGKETRRKKKKNKI